MRYTPELEQSMTHLNAMVIIRDRTAAASGLDESKKVIMEHKTTSQFTFGT